MLSSVQRCNPLAFQQCKDAIHFRAFRPTLHVPQCRFTFPHVSVTIHNANMRFTSRPHVPHHTCHASHHRPTSQMCTPHPGPFASHCTGPVSRYGFTLQIHITKMYSSGHVSTLQIHVTDSHYKDAIHIRALRPAFHMPRSTLHMPRCTVVLFF